MSFRNFVEARITLIAKALVALAFSHVLTAANINVSPDKITLRFFERKIIAAKPSSWLNTGIMQESHMVRGNCWAVTFEVEALV